jgi:hypothetical protein
MQLAVLQRHADINYIYITHVEQHSDH